MLIEHERVQKTSEPDQITITPILTLKRTKFKTHKPVSNFLVRNRLPSNSDVYRNVLFASHHCSQIDKLSMVLSLRRFLFDHSDNTNAPAAEGVEHEPAHRGPTTIHLLAALVLFPRGCGKYNAILARPSPHPLAAATRRKLRGPG